MIDPATVQFIEQRLAAFMQEVAGRAALANDGRGEKFSTALIETLTRKVASLEQQLRAARTFWDDLQPRVFLLKKTGGNQWQEQTVVDNTVQDFIDGRKATADSDPNALIEPQDEVVAAIEFPDGDKMRTVRIGGGGDDGNGLFQYMVRAMDAQRVKGWDDVRGAPER